MFRSLRTTLGAALAFAAAAALASAPASARDSYVQDGASLFGASTVSALNTKISNFHNQTGKEVLVVTVPSLDGSTAADAAEKVFASQQVNGVLIYLAKAEKQDGLLGDRASRKFFPDGFNNIRQAMRSDFRAGDYDSGITTGVGLVIDTYNGHTGSLRSQHAYSGSQPVTANTGGGGMSIFWLILILVAGFLIIRAIFRAISGPRVMPPGYGGPGYGGPGMPPMGGMGYGGGYGGGGGGGFFSGLLGGLGGAFIGNELFGRHDNQGLGGGYGDQSSFGGGNYDGGNAGDSAGWQSDPGQADVGNASFGDFGGGGSDFGGGGGDSGGGGGW